MAVFEKTPNGVFQHGPCPGCGEWTCICGEWSRALEGDEETERIQLIRNNARILSDLLSTPKKKGGVI